MATATTPLNRRRIIFRRMGRYYRVGRLLILTSITGGSLGCWFSWQGLAGLASGKENWIMPAILACCSTGIALIALLDCRSRYQDYKRVKDLFFENGFHPRLAGLYMKSRCQRDAAGAAAEDLGIRIQLDRFYYDKGYRWFHLLPDIMIRRPRFLFSRRYWAVTLFAPAYRSRYFLW